MPVDEPGVNRMGNVSDTGEVETTMTFEPDIDHPEPVEAWMAWMDTLSAGELGDALRAQAKGLYAEEASVELLICHGTWLRRPDFRAFINVCHSLSDETALMAGIDWERATTANLPASGSETQVLELAASIAGIPSQLPLSELLSGLDDANTLALMRAVLHAHRGAEADPIIVAPFG
jgi:hypothetical protein